MLDWDDVRYFLTVARAPTVRAAAERLSVNHSTVLRRIAQLESRLGTQLFEKLPSGYRLTEAGAEVLESAQEMERHSQRFEALVVGRDQEIGGTLRIALPPTLATHLLAPDLAEFARRYPAIEMDVVTSNEPVNLTNREADIAIRVVYDPSTLPPNLHGLPGPQLMGGVYIARDLLAAIDQGCADSVRWVVKTNYGIPDWAKDHGLTLTGPAYRTNDAESQLAAVCAGLGPTTLNCFVGDGDERLTRVPGTSLHLHGGLWVLTQGETRKTRRVQLFKDYIHHRLTSHADLLAGRKPQPPL